MINLCLKGQRTVCDKNRPSQLTVKSGRGQYLGHMLMVSDVK